MSQLKPQNPSLTVLPQHKKINWPTMDLPEADPRIGMNTVHINALQDWYAGLQTTLNAHSDAQASQITALSTQIAALKKGG